MPTLMPVTMRRSKGNTLPSWPGIFSCYCRVCVATLPRWDAPSFASASASVEGLEVSLGGRCGHCFHQTCIDKWLEECNNFDPGFGAGPCPNCRDPLIQAGLYGSMRYQSPFIALAAHHAAKTHGGDRDGKADSGDERDYAEDGDRVARSRSRSASRSRRGSRSRRESRSPT